MTVEMSLVGSLCLLASTYKSPDDEAIRQHGFFYGWTPLMMGFVMVSALLVTALLPFVFDGKPPSLFCLLALPLVMTSISIYQKYPYRVKKKEE
ncbi:putative nucleotide-sugar transporter [Helianthus annuus]|nr:putative nucleotide-sugar transporter [Helianthus annuus]